MVINYLMRQTYAATIGLPVNELPIIVNELLTEQCNSGNQIKLAPE